MQKEDNKENADAVDDFPNDEPPVSETIPIPEPRSQPPPGFFETEEPQTESRAFSERTYSIPQLLELRDHPSLQEYSGELPDPINRNNNPVARKRRYPFVDRNRKAGREYFRKNNGAGTETRTGRWSEKPGKWRGKGNQTAEAEEGTDPQDYDEKSKNKKKDKEQVIDQEEADPNEPPPQWDVSDEEDIVNGPSFEFRVLDRDRDRKTFQETGQVPQDAKLISRQEYQTIARKKQEEQEREQNPLPESQDERNILSQSAEDRRFLESMEWNVSSHTPEPTPSKETASKQRPPQNESTGLDSLFRNLNVSNELPSIPDEAIQSTDLEQNSAQMTGVAKSMGTSLFERYDHQFGDRQQERPQDMSPRQREEMMNAEMDQRERERGRLDGRLMDERMRRHGGGRGEFDVNFGRDLQSMGLRAPMSAPDGPPSHSQSPHRDPMKQGGTMVAQMNKMQNPLAPPHHPNVTPLQRMDNILYEVTSPVKPCIGGQFFANVRPLSNKELYDYSPKFKEIQDTRHKAMKMEMRMEYRQRQRHMYNKYQQAKKLYADQYQMPKTYGHERQMYPADQNYPPHEMKPGMRGSAGPRQMEYRRDRVPPRERPEYSDPMTYEMMRNRAHMG